MTVVDSEAPVIDCPADDVVSNDLDQCSAVYTVPSATATDNCDTTPDVSCDLSGSVTIPVGTTTVNCNAQDEAGNESTEILFIIIFLFGIILNFCAQNNRSMFIHYYSERCTGT